MKYTNLFSVLVIVLFTMSMFSCQKDWLSPPPENTLIATDSTFSKNENAVKFVNACYGQLTDWTVSVFSWSGVSSISSDDADKGSDPGDLGADKDQFDNLTYGPTSLSVAEVWSGNYVGVNRCNQAIENVPKFTIADGLKKQYIAEAKFLRAHFYFNLVRIYGGVPKIDGVFSSDDVSKISAANKRASEDEIYDLIISDLNTAVADLATKDVQIDKGRATKEAAEAMLAKVYLYRKNFAKSAELTTGLISSNKFSLIPNYAEIWRQSSENGPESLFEIQGQNGDDGWGIGGYFTHQGARGTVTDGFGGWGFNTPTADLEAAFETNDVRKNATIYRPGETLWDGAVVGTDAANARYNYKAYVSKTMEANYDDWSSGKNIRVMRYAEVLLINAEATNELGQTDNAIEQLNKVRNRAGLPNTTAVSKDDVRNAIWKERRVELAMEHDRFFDLVRQGRAGTVMRAHGKPFVDGKHEKFPIPLSQILISQGLLGQNAGY